MANANGPVTELVQIPVHIPVVDFLDIFAKTLEPILLAQPGLISILTGPTMEAKGEQEMHPFAVSLTQWESMDAHAAFLASASAGPFFSRLQSLVKGPPSVEHYYLGQLEMFAMKSRYACIIKSDSAAAQNRLAAYSRQVQRHGDSSAMTGPCIEVPSTQALVLFGDEPQFEAIGGAEKAARSMYTVKWECRGTAQVTQHL